LCFAISAPSFARTNQRSKATIEKREFGKLTDGTAIDLYTLTNRNGIEVKITNYGGAVVSVRTPDRTGKMTDIVLGYDQPQGYVEDTSFFGALVSTCSE
jgi:aldose 1-epimerase